MEEGINNMHRKISIRSALKIWAEYTPLPEDHIPQQRLYIFSLTNGLKKACKNEIRHLSLCPRCFDVWKFFCDLENPDSRADDYTDSGSRTILSCGTLQAASSGFTGPVYIKSDCGRFMLGILPETGSLKKAMIVLETANNGTSYQGMRAMVKDAGGIIILDAGISHGRAAAKTDRLDIIDLSTWSLVLSDSLIP